MGGILSWLAAILLAGGGALGILSLGGGLARESRRRMLPRLAAAAGAALLLLTGASLIVRWLAGPVFFLIEDGEKSLLYANDTGWFPEETWEWLEQHGPHLDFVSLDCTAGLLTGWRNGHMGLDTAMEALTRLRRGGDIHRPAQRLHTQPYPAILIKMEPFQNKRSFLFENM